MGDAYLINWDEEDDRGRKLNPCFFITNKEKLLQGDWTIRGIPAGGFNIHPIAHLDEVIRGESELAGN